ncbi:MAG TPA: Plug domain-containing protein, partial [Luteitalea sp.]|nr:Plug domain-containing protein [Luteitalea sp.]
MSSAILIPAVAVLLAAVLEGRATAALRRHSDQPGPACAVRVEVRDASAAVLPGATLVDPATRAVIAVTDGAGTACVDADRHVRVEVPGFVPVTVTTTTGMPAVVLAPAFQADVEVAAERRDARLRDAPVRTEVVSREFVEQIGARTLADAVEYTTGVRVESNCQNCNFSQVRLLGLEGPYTQILMDGQPTLSSLAQVYGLEQIPARLIDRIEVTKG